MKMVQRFLVCFILGISSVGQMIAAAPDDLLASYHFVGAADLAGNTNTARLKKIFALPETVQFRNDVLQKLAGASLKFIGADSGNAKQVALARPLFDDLLRAESQAELRGKTDSGAEFILAARLNDERSRLWETNLLQLTKTSKPQPAKLDDASGWQTKTGASFLKFFRAGKWTVVVLGPEQSTAQTDFLKRLRQQPANPRDREWLEADVDWPRLKPWLPLDKLPLKLARTELRVTGKDENLRTTVRVVYPEKIDWKSEAWRIPTGLIRDPLISFAAGQNVASFLKPTIVPPQLSVNPLTNQIYFWAQGDMPFQSYFATPVKDATNTMKRLGPQIAATFNDDLKRRGGGELKMASNRVDLFWQGLPPFIIPFLRPAKTDNMEVLLGGLFLPRMTTNLPPNELLAQISGRNNLVYYDWEITQQRLLQWRNISQILPFFPKKLTSFGGKKRLVGSKMAERQWLEAVGPMLGNTVTEVTFKSPNELNILRKSHLGLNSVELVFLSHWLADPNFPFANKSAPSAGATSAPQAPSRGRPQRP